MNEIIQAITELPEFEEVAEGIQHGERRQHLGLGRAARLPVAAALHIQVNRPVLLLTQRTDMALTAADELRFWLPEARQLFFPEPASLLYENIPWGENTRRERLLALKELAATHIPGAEKAVQNPVMIGTARGVMTRTLPRREFLKATQTIRPGYAINPTVLAEKLVGIGYEPAGTVTSVAQFARRGGILDVWPPAEAQPTRLEFFGDEIESLRYFDPVTQRTSQMLEMLLVTPGREFLPKNAVLGEWGSGEINEFHLAMLHKTPAGLLDYLPEDAVVMVDDWDTIRESINHIEEQAVDLRKEHVANGVIGEDFPIPYLTLAELQDTLDRRQTLELGPVADPDASKLARVFVPGPRFGGRLKPLIEHIHEVDGMGDRVMVISRQAARLEELWQDSLFDEVNDLAPRFLQGSMAEGWTLTPEKGVRWHVFTDGEIFGWKRTQPRRRPRVVAKAPESGFVDFQINDVVVHIDHGVGRFKGLVEREIDGFNHEYLCVEYAGGDQLYVPVHQADRLSHYVGAKGYRPSLNRLGGVEWHHIKSKVKTAVKQVAEDLLELYAKRQAAPGLAFNTDTAWQKELEASFPYVETDDQLRVIAEVKRDMESKRPMDRLVCGDVGYGKTEVALRAAFKAVMDGKQVALLVPTTILAQQHFDTFSERLRAFPVKVAMLSRFRSAKEQEEIIKQLADGRVDIIIGTHRLVQADVQFNDLGLVVIDEEQRFGVTHKEHLKKLRTEVDVLTMTATPIPRTLYMALAGVRDISTINTPPEERLPISTHVGAYTPRLVRQAVVREIERGGQVFFVHNRVQTINAVRSQLEHLIPEARFATAHGQMAERELSKRMREFTDGEIDVLVTTSIIESGLDIPNANTLIVDRADRFGLAQLYQLRGRVGRGAQRAYAYFFQHRKNAPSDEGRMRLETLAENTQLGAGYSIAMRDLEIRGAGDVLGTRQHGHIAAVGFHLYTRLLSQAVNSIRQTGDLAQDPVLASMAVYHPMINMDLPLAINIPQEYVPDKDLRLRLYRRMAETYTQKDMQDLKHEFEDRFGEIPEPVGNMFYQLEVKRLAELSGLSSVSVESKQIVLRFPSLPEGAAGRNYPNLGPTARTGKNAIWLPLQSLDGWQSRLMEVLEILGSWGEEQKERLVEKP